MVWNEAAVYTQIIIHVALRYMNPKPTIIELMLEAVTQCCSFPACICGRT